MAQPTGLEVTTSLMAGLTMRRQGRKSMKTYEDSLNKSLESEKIGEEKNSEAKAQGPLLVPRTTWRASAQILRIRLHQAASCGPPRISVWNMAIAGTSPGATLCLKSNLPRSQRSRSTTTTHSPARDHAANFVESRTTSSQDSPTSYLTSTVHHSGRLHKARSWVMEQTHRRLQKASISASVSQ